ncbi:MAG: hypothetical protein QOE36_731, partial [Gaiellaceae bacterium]|nr:hypothetical protein [Gaiellaceae bacterium]
RVVVGAALDLRREDGHARRTLPGRQAGEEGHAGGGGTTRPRGIAYGLRMLRAEDPILVIELIRFWIQ